MQQSKNNKQFTMSDIFASQFIRAELEKNILQRTKNLFLNSTFPPKRSFVAEFQRLKTELLKHQQTSFTWTPESLQT